MAAPYALSDTVFDEALNYLANNCKRIVVTDADTGVGTGTPYTDATTLNGVSTGKQIAIAPSGSDLTSGNFTLADRSGGGRKVTVDSQSAVPVTAAGDASHLCWIDNVNNEVLFTTQLSVARTGLTTSDTLDIPAHFAAILDAVAAT